MRRSLSLRARLLAGVAVVAIILVAAAWAIVSNTRNHLVDQVDEHLVATADIDRDGRLGDGLFDRRHDESARGNHLPSHESNLQSREQPGRLSNMFEGAVHRNRGLETLFEPNLPDQAYSPPDLDWNTVVNRISEPFTASAVDDDVRYRVLAVELRDIIFVRALPLTDVEETVDRLIQFVVFGAGSIFLVLTAVAWWVIRLGIQPIRAMTDAATEIADGNLSLRVPEPKTVGTEAGALARGLNVMLGRIKTAVDSQAQSQERLRRFVADASHELRTPITTIRGYAELYRQGGLAEGRDLEDAMRRTEQEAQRLDRLVEDMLTLARFDQERPIGLSEIDLSTIIADTEADARVAAPNHVFAATIEPDISITGDEDRLRQVLANVVNNAAVHTPPGTSVTIDARRLDDNVVVEISDNGPGIDSDHLARITERFYRADPSRSREHGGSGLGLSIADTVVQAHGGSLDVASEPDLGTSVTITLPLRPPQTPMREGEEPTQDKEKP